MHIWQVAEDADDAGVGVDLIPGNDFEITVYLTVDDRLNDKGELNKLGFFYTPTYYL
jgi:hypothetical protein